MGQAELRTEVDARAAPEPAPPSSEGAPPRPAPIVVDRYEIHHEIGSGGMATVHLGRLRGPAGFARTVAVKRLHPTYAKDPDFAAMFLDEARLSARIRHPGVVPTLDVLAKGGELFLVMDFVLGDALSSLLRGLATRRAPPAIAAAIMIDVLNGLHAAHQATGEDGTPLGIVHRDVSPQNVLVGVDGVSRVLDFGIAKATGRLHTTRDGQIKGKLSYMAPEQIGQGGVDRRADVFSASIVLWEALVGRLLFAREEAASTFDAVLRAPVPPPSSLAPGISTALDAVVLRGLDRDCERRFETAKAMAVALAEVTPIADAQAVSAWVRAAMGPRLAARERLVREIESFEAAPPSAPPLASNHVHASSPTDATSRETVPPPTTQASLVAEDDDVAPRARLVRWKLPAAVAAGIALVLLGWTLARIGAPRPAAEASFAVARSALPPATPPSAPLVEPPAATPRASAPEPPSSASTTAARKPPPRPISRPPICRDPFRVDEHGILVPRPECFR